MMNHFSLLIDASVATLITTWLWLPRGGYTVGSVALCVGVAVAVALRRRWPRAVPVVVFVATVVGWSLGSINDPFIAFSWSLIPIAVEHWRAIRRWLPALWVAVIASALIAVDGVGVLGAAPVAVLVSLIIAEAEGHQRHLDTRETEVAFAQHTARELHDGIGHSLSIIRAETGLLLMSPQVAQSAGIQDCLTRIDRHAEAAFTALGQIVEAYTGSGESSGGSLESTAALTIHEVIAADRAAGLDITVHGSIPGGEIPVQIVQEMVRNVRQYGANKQCALHFEHCDGQWVVRCTNAVDPARGGGLMNLTARAEALGGSARWGCVDGLFSAEVCLPVTPETQVQA